MEKKGKGREVWKVGERKERASMWCHVLNFVPCVGVLNKTCEMWCTNGVILFRRQMGVLGTGGRGFENRGEVGKKGAPRGWAKKSRYLSRPPQECGVPLSSITLLGNSESFIKGLNNQGPSGDVFRGVVQKIWTVN